MTSTQAIEGYLDKIINSVADPIFVKNRRHEWVLLNDACCQFIGDTRGRLIGRSDYDVFPKQEADVFWERDEEVFRSQKENVNEEAFTDRLGVTHTVLTKKTLYMDPDGALFIVGVIRDITDRKRMEEELKALNSTLEERVAERSAAAEKRAEELALSNAELERFAYVASHDLQEPLRNVASYVQLLARRYQDKLDQDAKDFIQFAVDGVKRMKDLINGILEYSRIGQKEQAIEKTDAQIAVGQALANLELMLHGKNASISCYPLPVVMSNPVPLTEVLQNLISNAVKFCESGSPEVHIGAERQGDFWRFYVRDNGIGIDKKHSSRIFDIFQRLHPSDKYPGTGLGLAICKKIVERQGGRIWVESEPGRGATFCFLLKALP